MLKDVTFWQAFKLGFAAGSGVVIAGMLASFITFLFFGAVSLMTLPIGR